MKTLYFDLFSGISGDMAVGALLDLGVDFLRLEAELAKLNLNGCHLHVSREKRFQIEGTKFDVHIDASGESHAHSHDNRAALELVGVHGAGGSGNRQTGGLPHMDETLDHPGHSHDHPHSHSHSQPSPFTAIPGLRESFQTQPPLHHEGGRNFADIKQLIGNSSLSDWVKTKSIAIFQRIANAEGKIHGHPPDQVHFHEVGAVDSIIDIVGFCIALDLLGRPRVLCSPVIEGIGWIDCAHGRFPVPAPATLEILSMRDVTVSQCEEPHELVTPTGAALMAEMAEQFGPMQTLKPERIGFGIGARNNKTRPNVLRAILGESAASTSHDWETDAIAVLETNLDDINSEVLGYFIERAISMGALDVFYTPIQMKKSRPAVMLTVLCESAHADKFSELILRETTTFGVRRTIAERRKLRREIRKVSTSFGEIAIKFGMLDGEVIQASPEFESCKAAAQSHGVPIKQVYEAAKEKRGIQDRGRDAGLTAPLPPNRTGGSPAYGFPVSGFTT